MFARPIGRELRDPPTCSWQGGCNNVTPVRSVSLVAGAGALLLTGCFYVDPINRRPQIGSVQRVCDGSEPGVPCDFTDLHRGDSVRIKAMFTDPDSAVENSSVTWVISACDSSH